MSILEFLFSFSYFYFERNLCVKTAFLNTLSSLQCPHNILTPSSCVFFVDTLQSAHCRASVRSSSSFSVSRRFPIWRKRPRTRHAMCRMRLWPRWSLIRVQVPHTTHPDQMGPRCARDCENQNFLRPQRTMPPPTIAKSYFIPFLTPTHTQETKKQIKVGSIIIGMFLLLRASVTRNVSKLHASCTSENCRRIV